MPARVRLALMVTATLVLLGALGAVLLVRPAAEPSTGPTGLAGAVPPEVPVRDFVLRDQDGERVALSDFRGKVTVLTFLYSTCQDTCPVTATTIRGALDDLGHDVPVLAVSVDPANDTPASASRFLAKRRMTGRMRFLLGDRPTLARVWKDYGVLPQGDGFDHSATVLLLDRAGRQQASYLVSRLTSEDLVHDIRLLEARPTAPRRTAATARDS